jgi:hypothetical protein
VPCAEQPLGRGEDLGQAIGQRLADHVILLGAEQVDEREQALSRLRCDRVGLRQRLLVDIPELLGAGIQGLEARILRQKDARHAHGLDVGGAMKRASGDGRQDGVGGG